VLRVVVNLSGEWRFATFASSPVWIKGLFKGSKKPLTQSAFDRCALRPRPVIRIKGSSCSFERAMAH